MSNISLKCYYWEKLTFSNIDFLNLKKFVSRSVFRQLQLIQISPNFTTSCSNYWGQRKTKNTLVSGNAGDQKNLHPGGHKFFFFFNRFSGHILFSSLVSFAFSDSSLFFELKNVYSDTHWTMRGVSDKKFSPSRFQETRLLFFWSEFWEQNCMWLFCY